MKSTAQQFKQILLTATFMFCVVTAISQVKQKNLANKPIIVKPISNQLKDFYHLTTDANVLFSFPAGFKEIKVLNNEDFSFDYAMEMPGGEFETWFQVKPQKQDWLNYERSKNDVSKQTENPDSLYSNIGRALATTFTGDQNYLTRTIPPDVLTRYNATTGRSYLLNLQDMRATKRYKYALLIALQKSHIGTVIAVCFANEKSPEFFKNINRMSKYIKFKP